MNLKSLVLAGITIGCMLSVCACGDVRIPGRNVGTFEGNSVTYNDVDYLVGNAQLTDKIRNIKIDWLAGDINIEYNNEGKVIIEEDESDLSEENRLRYRVDGDSLSIQFVKSGVMPIKLSKDLRISIPKGAKLGVFEFDATSANINFDSLTVEKFEADTTSGCVIGNEIISDSKIEMDTTSGGMKLKKCIADALDFDSTSGDVIVDSAQINNNVNIDTVSGKTQVVLPEICDVDLSSTSGSLYLTTSADSSFSVDFDTVSGDLNSDIDLKIVDGCYVRNTGTHKVSVDTVSGDINIQEYVTL